MFLTAVVVSDSNLYAVLLPTYQRCPVPENAPNSAHLSLKLPSELARSIEKHAEQLGVSKSAVCRMLLRTGTVPTLPTTQVVQR